MNGIEKINRVIDYVEEHITEDIPCAALARLSTLSEYEFRRIFSFIIGVPVAEYIRKRRLALAAEELKSGSDTVSNIGTKYGYNSASAFTRAFKDTFGVTPNDAKSEDVKLSIYLKPRLEFSLKGGDRLEYTEKTLGDFFIVGVSGISPITDTVCCESVWKKYEKYAGNSMPDKIYAAYINGEKDVLCYIGEANSLPSSGDHLKINGGRWLSIDVCKDADEQTINDLYEKILFTFLPSLSCKRDESRPNLEVFCTDGSFCIMIPVK